VTAPPAPAQLKNVSPAAINPAEAIPIVARRQPRLRDHSIEKSAWPPERFARQLSLNNAQARFQPAGLIRYIPGVVVCLSSALTAARIRNLV